MTAPLNQDKKKRVKNAVLTSKFMEEMMAVIE